MCAESIVKREGIIRGIATKTFYLSKTIITTLPFSTTRHESRLHGRTPTKTLLSTTIITESPFSRKCHDSINTCHQRKNFCRQIISKSTFSTKRNDSEDSMGLPLTHGSMSAARCKHSMENKNSRPTIMVSQTNVQLLKTQGCFPIFPVVVLKKLLLLCNGIFFGANVGFFWVLPWIACRVGMTGSLQSCPLTLVSAMKDK